MIIIPGFFISAVTFPGVMVHEFAHKLFCQWTGTKVLKVCYFRRGNPAGFVVHERPTNVWKHILIGIGPLFLNTAAGFSVGLLALPLRHAGTGLGALQLIIMLWLAVSIAMHAFPSTGDAKSIWTAIWRRGTSLGARIVGAPLVGLIYLGALGSVLGLNVLYGIAVVIGLPILMQLNN